MLHNVNKQQCNDKLIWIFSEVKIGIFITFSAKPHPPFCSLLLQDNPIKIIGLMLSVFFVNTVP